ncbi:glyoxalase superfamily protein [Pseudomonas putida]|uniref:glyoxalase superfamily protein n=1 Tax=Pseudomonas putida TaxID=303 RepID=UPI0018D99417|nr:glyoxalase superfamily protein [Pseudomonas putida]MBH3459266.1 hypothetical protein [Pseudomonas putida]
MLTTAILKAQSKRLRAHLAKNDIVLTHSQGLEAVAALHGHRDWNTASAVLGKANYPDYLPLEVFNSGVGVLSGCLNTEGKLLVENTHEAKLLSFFPGESYSENDENLLIVLKPSALAGRWKCEGRDNRLGTPWISPPFIFSLQNNANP